jgi:hypothetical protein
MVFSGGIRPRDRDLEAIREAGLFAYLVDEETYAVASEVHDLLVKTHPADTAKIEATKRLVIDHFDVDGLLARLDSIVSRSAGVRPSAFAVAAAPGEVDAGARSPRAVMRRVARRVARSASAVRARGS